MATPLSRHPRLPFVIPAKAGIHLQKKTWIPAFAGMTEEETGTAKDKAGMTNSLQVALKMAKRSKA
jgi:hypothetical protein